MPPGTSGPGRPRTCRICLETVYPSARERPADEATGADGGAGGAAAFEYVSDGGRLLRPCRCKGTSKYVHESCLQTWRHSDPSYGRPHYWQCPTCRFKYRLERVRWAHLIGSLGAQIGLTAAIFLLAVYLLGFVADPLLTFYLGSDRFAPPAFDGGAFAAKSRGRKGSWAEHLLKGFATLGLVGFLKLFIASPWRWWNLRSAGMRSRRSGSARGGLSDVVWIYVLVGISTFLIVSVSPAAVEWASCELD